MVIDVTDNYDKFQFAQALQITEEFFGIPIQIII